MTKKITKDNTVHITNRLYGVVTASGKLGITGTGGPAVFFTRQEARDWALEGERVVRLPDLTCLVV